MKQDQLIACSPLIRGGLHLIPGGLDPPAQKRRRATSGRSLTELLGVDEGPHDPIVDTRAALGQLADQPTQREVTPSTTLQEPLAMCAYQFLWPVPERDLAEPPRVREHARSR
jgi:hypothetical protein